MVRISTLKKTACLIVFSAAMAAAGTTAQAKPDDSTHGTNCTKGYCLCSGKDACDNLKATCDDNDGDWTDATDRGGIPYGKCEWQKS